MKKLDKPLNLSFSNNVKQNDFLSTSVQKQGDEAEQPLNEMEKEIQAKNRQIIALNQEIQELKVKNDKLLEENREIQQRQTCLRKDLSNAEAQLQLITELIHKEQERNE